MVEFIDKTTEKNGTPINRANLMGLQGFLATTTTINDDGTIVETNADGHTLTTVYNEDGSITEIFQGEKRIVKTITFEGNVVKEVLS